MHYPRGRLVDVITVIVWAVLLTAVAGAAIRLMPAPAPPAEPTPVIYFTGPSHERDSIVSWEARRAGAPPVLMIAVSHVENWSGDSTAVHPRSGATGLMQVMPTLWSDSFHVECGIDSLINRRRNACVGARVWLGYFQACGNAECALRSYVGAACTPKDPPRQCADKVRAGTDYVLAVVQRYGRTDLSPARDEMAAARWRGQGVASAP